MADSSQPTFIKVGPNGEISYEFDGRLIARGVDLLAATAGPEPADRLIRWLREADGAVVAQVGAAANGADHYTRVEDGFQFAENRLQLATADGSRSRVTVQGGAPSFPRKARTVIASTGGSAFLQLDSNAPDPAPKRSMVASVTLTFAGGTFAAGANFSHLFGAPVRAIATQRFTGAPMCVCNCENVSLNEIGVRAETNGLGSPAAGVQVVVELLIIEL
ncbi:hypothetical protein GKE82_05965 [Conexibacter sp. W3-3-2]|uniref:hypothetical protein n=1 Tax=Conexibacter sp. W3-3-2 TaxID=2675227 RepID=UPI0012B9846A|nr:hypothetical protein [Conexibacter sp. W3-3-2]MTD43862.1 hypothetical protein [Conexibacter sp. W3-3-2]